MLDRLQEEIVEFLAHGPTPEEIIAFQPSTQVVAYLHTLQTQKRETLSATEKVELEQAEWLDNLMTRIKTRAQLHTRRLSKLRARSS